MKKSVKIVTLGCPKNIVDSEVLAAQLKANNYQITFQSPVDDNQNTHHCNYVIINTCGFINDAKQESIDTILRYTDARKKGDIQKLIVTGCLSQRYKPELSEELPEVDAFFGTEAYRNILKSLGDNYNHRLLSERSLITPPHYAYLKIAEGCNRKCSFCAIPLIRGKYVSKPIKKIIDEAKMLAEKGVKEIILIAEDTTYYGLDIYGKQRLPLLTEKISLIKGIEWIRIQYAFPNKFPLELLKVISQNPKVCKYLDIPFQHINDNILKSMKRGIDKTKTLRLIDKIRNQVPDISLRTSIITGYPLETDVAFSELNDFIKTTSFERLGVFTYSHEENTSAFKLKDSIPLSTKLKRAALLMKTQQKISLKHNKQKIGKHLKVIIDSRNNQYYIGRTQADAPEIDNRVLIPANKINLKTGNFYSLKISSAAEYDIFALPAE